jgi:hypothetical protein
MSAYAFAGKCEVPHSCTEHLQKFPSFLRLVSIFLIDIQILPGSYRTFLGRDGPR